MQLKSRMASILILMASTCLSSASIDYSNVSAKLSYNGEFFGDLAVLVDGNSITFLPPPVLMISNPGPDIANLYISYDATSDVGVNGTFLIFAGSTQGTATIDFGLSVWDDGGQLIGQLNGQKSGDSAFVNQTLVAFANGPENFYHVEESFLFVLDWAGNPSPGAAATIGFVEQNAVPEPLAAVSLISGLIVLSRKRRQGSGRRRTPTDC